MNITRILITVLILLSFSVQARMYQWNDPDTGTTQLSGKPPAWYRSDQGGPRVIVFEKGTIIDDTSIRVSDDKREALRLEALLRVEGDREIARQKVMEAEQIKAKMDKSTDGKEHIMEDEVAEISGDETTPVTVDTGKTSSPGNITEEAMRTLLYEWEKQLTENAIREAGKNYIRLE
jgi:hypothetical protein